MTRRITLSDVARRAGVSVSTVSFVLNDRPGSRIPETTAANVRAAAQALGYTPDHYARGLKTGRSKAIGFISDEVTVTRYASAMIRGILNVGEANQHAVFIAETGHGERELVRAIRELQSRRVDGLILGMMQARELDVPNEFAALPMVVVNGTAGSIPAILPDEYTAGERTVHFLLERGHRTIGLVGRSPLHQDPRVSVTIGRRFRGLDAAMKEAGLGFALEVPGHEWEPDLGYRAAQEIVSRPDVTAVVAANDRIGFGLHQGLAQSGTPVPDVSVISFDDDPLASYLRPGLTTTQLPYERMGEVAAGLVLRRASALQGEGKCEMNDAETLVPMPLIVRSSVAVLAS